MPRLARKQHLFLPRRRTLSRVLPISRKHIRDCDTPTDEGKCNQQLYYFCGSSSEFLQLEPASTPEPGTLLMAALGLLYIAKRRFTRPGQLR